jgi:hypothetical protein
MGLIYFPAIGITIKATTGRLMPAQQPVKNRPNFS